MPSLMEFQARSDLFEHRYYRVNKMISKLIGQWPYQSARTRSIFVSLLLLIAASQMIPQTIATVKHLDDRDVVTEAAIPFTFGGIVLTKLFFSTLNSKTMLMLLNRMRMDWDVLAMDHDVDILHKYAEIGRKLTVVYTVLYCTTCIIFLTQPVVPKIIDILLRNGTEPGTFPIPVDYLLIDEQKYYIYILLHVSVTISTAFIVGVTYDSLFAIYILHGCGLYAVLGRKLERIGKNKRSGETYNIAYALGKPDMDFKDLSLCIAIHHKAIEYADLIEACHSWCFFFIMGYTTFLITITGLQIITTTIEPHETLRFVVSNIGTIIGIYSECYMAQTLMDHSSNIRYYILNSEWYRLPPKVQKFLILMILRCNIPCEITAGKIFVLTIEQFCVIVKASLSYFTLLRSI